MASSDSVEAGKVQLTEAKEAAMAEIMEPYLREQLEKRRDQLRQAIASPDAHIGHPAFFELLREVDSALERMDHGAYGICENCHDAIERERLICDPLARFCIDHLSGDEQRALEGDLELASRIQRGLLPKNETQVCGWRVHYEYSPAGLVSGDYCDVIAPQDGIGKPIFLVGDVAGKGVAASLLMTHLHAMFRSLAVTDVEVCKLLDMGNRIFCESTIAGQYATLICARAGDGGEVEIASAGHLPALLVGKDGVEEIAATGLPLGMFCNARYTVRRIHLDLGDSLLLFTDGISEAHNAVGAEFGVERLSVAAGERYGRPPQEFLGQCLSDVRAFSSGVRQSDDQTLMIVQRADAAT
jgi:phosphoserine phosphatase RsbU/P